MYKKTLILSIVEGVGKIVPFLLTPFFLNLMSKEDFGENNYIIAIVSTLPVFLTLGFHTTQIKEFIKENDISEKQNILTTSLATSLFVSTFILFMIYIFRLNENIVIDFLKINQNKEFKWILFCLYTITSCTGLILYSFAISLNDTKSLIIFSISKMVFINSFSLFFVYFKFNIDTSLSKLLGIVFGDILFNIFFFFLFCKSFWIWNFSFKFFKKALKLGAPLIPAALATIISTSSDRYFIVKNYDMSLIAEYSLALLFLTPINLMMVSSQTTLTPLIFSLNDNKEAYKYSVSFFIRYLIIALCLFIFIQLVVFIARNFKLIPHDYIYLNYLILLLFFQISIFTSLQIPFNIFIKNNKTIMVALISICISILSVISGIFVTPNFGFSGLIIVNACICLFFLIFSFYLARRISF